MNKDMEKLIDDKICLEAGFSNLFIYLHVFHPEILETLFKETESSFRTYSNDKIKEAMKIAMPNW